MQRLIRPHGTSSQDTAKTSRQVRMSARSAHKGKRDMNTKREGGAQGVHAWCTDVTPRSYHKI